MTAMIDLTGKQFGYWRVIKYDESSRGKAAKWICKCTHCYETYRSIFGYMLTGNHVEHDCGCGRYFKIRLDLAGTEINGWKIIQYIYGSDKWLIRCPKCGKTKLITRFRLMNRAKNLFCYGCDTKRGTSLHGLTAQYHREYISFRAMMNRCYRTVDISYPHYGGRGICVSDAWKDNFPQFLHDMGQRPAGCTLDRIKVNENYSKENCRWSDIYTQAANRTDNAYETIDGITLIRNEWFKLANTCNNTIIYRMKKHGLSFKDALFKDKLLNVVSRVQIVVERVPIPNKTNEYVR